MWPNNRKIRHYCFECFDRNHGNYSLGMYIFHYFRCWSRWKVQDSHDLSNTQLKYIGVEQLPCRILCRSWNHNAFGQCIIGAAGYWKVGKWKPLYVGTPYFSHPHHRVRVQFLYRCINEHVFQLLERLIKELYWCSQNSNGKQFLFWLS